MDNNRNLYDGIGTVVVIDEQNSKGAQPNYLVKISNITTLLSGAVHFGTVVVIDANKHN